VASVTARVWRVWQERYDESPKATIDLLFQSDIGPAAARSALQHAVDQAVSREDRAQEELSPEEDPPGIGSWAVASVPEGQLLSVGNKCDVFEPLLKTVVRELTRLGVTGRFDVYESPPPTYPAWFPGAATHRGAHVWLTPPSQPAVDAPVPDFEDFERVTRTAVDWVLRSSPDVALVVEQLDLPAMPVKRSQDALEIVLDLIDRQWLTLTSIGESQFRRVVMARNEGRLSLIEGGPVGDHEKIPASLVNLKHFLRAHSSDIAYAFIRAGLALDRTTAPTILAGDERWPRFSYWKPHLTPTEPPDVFGIQLLGPGHRTVKASPNWTIETLPRDRFLFEHVEPERWFGPMNLEHALAGGEPPSPEQVTEGRIELTDLLFREPVEHQLPERLLLKLSSLPDHGDRRVALVLSDGRILENIQIGYFGGINFSTVPVAHSPELHRRSGR
jgi:hypothetical protein